MLEDVDIVGLEQAADNDLVELGRGRARRRHTQDGFRRRQGPGAGGNAKRAGGEHAAAAAVDNHQPPDIPPVGPNAARAGADLGPAGSGVDGIENHQAGIVDHAIGIFERGAKRPLQRVADRMVSDVDGGGCGKTGPGGEVVVEQKCRAQQPRRTFVGMRRDRKPHRSHQMRRDPEPGVALRQCCAHAQEPAALQDGQIAMDHARRRGRSGGAEIALLQQDHPQATARGVARHADTVQPAADDRQIVVCHARLPV